MQCKHCEKEAVYKCRVCGKPLCMEHIKFGTICSSCVKKTRLKHYAIGKVKSSKDRDAFNTLSNAFGVNRNS